MDILNDNRSRYYDPQATVADIEVKLNCSHRTAERWMARLKRDLNIKGWQRVTKSQLEMYFRKI